MEGTSFTQAAGEVLKRDGEFWFEDGNVVLITRRGVAFRVYRGLLAHNSSIFRDLFSVPQPPSAEQFEGCPVVQLSDEPEELRQLLKVIYHGAQSFRPDVQMEFSTVSVLIRLAHKYEIGYILDDGLSRLRKCFSDDLELWTKFNCMESEAPLHCESTDVLEAVNLARLTDTDSILPSALYMCCQLEAHTLLSGVRKSDGSMVRLAPDDLEKCVEGRGHLLNANIISTLRVFRRLPSGLCQRTELCLQYLQDTLERFTTDYDSGLNSFAVLDIWDDWCAVAISSGDLCLHCGQDVKNASLHERQFVWKKLPGIFGLRTAHVEAPGGPAEDVNT